MEEKQVSDRDYFVDQAGAKAFNEAFLRLVAEQHKQIVAQYMSAENSLRFRHRGSWEYPGAPEAVVGQPRQHSSAVETQFQHLVDNDLDTIYRNVQTLRDAMHRQFATMLYSTMSSVCEQTGNMVDAKAAGSVENALLEMMEKIELVADHNGEVRLPQIHASPETAAHMAESLSAVSPEFKQRLDDILQLKREEAIARESERKAKFARYGDDA
ncbi:hypothetical protein B0G57_11575 [Trinickia symbiotica]|uniref:Uncharacterized protein n=1 Tax=Trinickia symbiotica TaxID=863227 RepID=A0A2N7X5P4_9BURK|nr:hypothetical protein [Trinickia symbiotica]PMS37088.1 hypothetical protein C0Z20_10270 [Trinickia symbiotica]PPK42972.1 hypothetical protein B0G57_11575 [Trinickia symbiotica]